MSRGRHCWIVFAKALPRTIYKGSPAPYCSCATVHARAQRTGHEDVELRDPRHWARLPAGLLLVEDVRFAGADALFDFFDIEVEFA